MGRISICHRDEITLTADPQEVWRLADDVARYPEWVGVTLAVLDAPAVLETGATYTERTRVAGPLTVVSRWQVVEHDGTSLVQRHECADEPGPVKSMWLEMAVVPGEGRSTFALTIGCDVVAGPFTGPLAALMSRKLRTGNAENVQRFAALLGGQRNVSCEETNSAPSCDPYTSGRHS